jgi:hypothetical protein
MSTEDEKRLEAEIARALQGLPEQPAPATLLPRVLAAVQARAALPWRRRPWQTWPLPLQAALLAVLVACAGGMCLAGGELARFEGLARAAHEAAGWFAWVGALWDAGAALLNALLLVARHFGTAVFAATLVSLALGYALCVGLGAAWVRFAFARK